MARKFLVNAAGNPNAEFRFDDHGNVRVYDRATNTFANYDKNNKSVTLFKPPSGASYWDNNFKAGSWGNSTSPNRLTTTGKMLRLMRIIGRNME